MTETLRLTPAEPHNQRRMPIYLMLDLNDDFRGDQIFSISQFINLLYNELLDQPEAYELVRMSVIGFGDDAVQLTPLSTIGEFTLPALSTRGTGCRLGQALELCHDAISRELRFRDQTTKGDYKPLVFVLISSSPTDAFEKRALKLHGLVGQLIFLCVGNQVPLERLRQLSLDTFKLADLDAGSVINLLTWTSQSVWSDADLL